MTAVFFEYDDDGDGNDDSLHAVRVMTWLVTPNLHI